MIPPEGTLNEAESRAHIDAALISAGWVIQDKKRLNLYRFLDPSIRAATSGAESRADLRFVSPNTLGEKNAYSG